ncbi:hypothetical protein [Denitromonas sp.]|nr:hypothetical protein [Denitromonas sp.]
MDLAALLWTVLAAVLTVAELMTGSFYLLVLGSIQKTEFKAR